MKINFDGTFREVSRLLDTPRNKEVVNKNEGAFASLLSSISPDGPELSKNIVKSAEIAKTMSSSSQQEDRGMMASFKFSAPTPQPPTLNPIDSPILPNQPVNEPEPSVKTPSILGVRRVMQDGREIPAQFSELPKSERIVEVKKMVELAGMKYGIDPKLSMAVVSNESSFDTNAVSRDGHASKGLFQLLDTTGTHLLAKSGADIEYDPFNPELNVDLGVSYLKHLHEIFSKETELPTRLKTFAAANSSSLEKLAVAAFNAGEGRVASAQHRAKREGLDPTRYEQIERYLPESTREYVSRVTRSKDGFGAPLIDKFEG